MVEEGIDRLRSAAGHTVERGGKATLDLKAGLAHLALEEGMLRMCIRPAPQGCLRPQEVLAALNWHDWAEGGAYLTRTAVELAPPRRRGSPEHKPTPNTQKASS
jgi:hypothetical protein